jgi:hypothetical protein
MIDSSWVISTVPSLIMKRLFPLTQARPTTTTIAAGLVNLSLGRRATATASFDKCYTIDATLKPRFEALASEIISER